MVAQNLYLEDLQQAVEWFGVKSLDDSFGMSAYQQRPHHEQYARSFEAYAGGDTPGARAREGFPRFSPVI